MIMKIFKYIPLLLIVASISCTKVFDAPTEFSLFGNVTLEDETDYSGITVEVYSMTKMDTAVTNLQARFPSVGFPITQAAIFDHREKTPLYTTTTDENGDWSINKIEEGEYNIVARKAGYGWKYVYNVTAATEMPEIELKPEIRIEGTLDAYTVWGPDQHYVVTGDITVPENGQLIVDKGTVVRFDGQYGLTNYGTLKATGEADAFVWFTHNTPGEDVYWRGVLTSDENASLSIIWAHIDYAENGIVFRNQNNSSTIQNIIIHMCKQSGIFLANEGLGKVSKSIIWDCSLNIKLESKSNFESIYNLIACNEKDHCDGIYCSDSEFILRDNCLYNLKIGVQLLFESDITIEYNFFNNCEIPLKLGGSYSKPKCVVENNTFVETIYKVIELQGEIDYRILFNNIFKSKDDLFITGTIPTDEMIYISNNFWGVTSVDAILNMMSLSDAANGTLPKQKYNIEPILTSEIKNSYPRYDN